MSDNFFREIILFLLPMTYSVKAIDLNLRTKYNLNLVTNINLFRNCKEFLCLMSRN